MKCTDHTILVIDDSKVLRMLVSKMLIAERYNCEDTENAGEALTWLRDTPGKYDCILLDYMMPEMDGLTFLEHIHAEQLFPMAQIVMVSASPDTLMPYKKQYGLKCRNRQALPAWAAHFRHAPRLPTGSKYPRKTAKVIHRASATSVVLLLTIGL